MNSLLPVRPLDTKALLKRWAASNWIDLFALPLAASIMETQPFALVLLMLSDTAGGENAVPPLDATSITFLLLGLQWWGMLIHYLTGRGLKEEWAKFFHPAGFCAALVLAIVTHPALLTSIPALVTVAGLTVWFWRRGMKLAPIGASDSYLIVAFKICFLALLILLFCTVLYFSQTDADTPAFNALHVAMGSGLAIFFLSGLVCMSLTRLSIIKREDAYRAPGKSLTDPIRLWLVGLLLFWIGVTVLALAIETFSFGAVTNGALWLWNGFWNVMGGLLSLLAPLLAGLARLFSFLFPYFQIPRLAGSTSRPINTGSAQGATPLPDYVIQSIRLVVVLILLAVLVFVIRAILRRWQVKTRDDSEEEVREGLSMQVVWRQRRAEQGKRRQQASADPDLEILPANSARYHFRALLQALAERDDLARRDDETPEEYKTRLLSVLKRTMYSGDERVDQRQLEALTEAYMRERYGGEVSEMLDDTSLPAWIQDFTRRLER